MQVIQGLVLLAIDTPECYKRVLILIATAIKTKPESAAIFKNQQGEMPS